MNSSIEASIVEYSLPRSTGPIKRPDGRLAIGKRSHNQRRCSTDSAAVQPLERCKEPIGLSSIVDLPYEDIIVRHILPLLRIEDLLNLKLVSVLFNRLTVCYLRSLKRLNLSESRCLTTGQFRFILCISHNFLTSMDLSHNLSLNNRLLTRYLIVYRLKQLNSIKLNDCHWIDARSFSVLAMLYGRQLEHLECAGCWSLNDELIGLLTVTCPGLISLNLSMIYSLTDRSLLRIAAGCRRLRTLNLRGCWKLSPVGLCWLIGRSASQLIDLQLDQCHSNSLRTLVA